MVVAMAGEAPARHGGREAQAGRWVGLLAVVAAVFLLSWDIAGLRRCDVPGCGVRGVAGGPAGRGAWRTSAAGMHDRTGDRV